MEMMVKTPTKFFLVKGGAEGATKLNAFDRALIDAGIGDTNLIRLSSILPPGCMEIEPLKLPGGSFVPIAYSSLSSANPGEIITAGVAVGIPHDETLPGLIMEYSAVADTETVDEIVTNMIIEGFSYRNRDLRLVLTATYEHQVESIGAVFAGVVLWY